ncbi:MAG: type II secretion system GspH family protein, partial [Puniceicoccales bacterium]|nr:type II secretion system GspH family protein [Puniceicoccales bacterium]
NGFYQDTKLSDHLIATGNLKPRHPRTSVPFHTSEYPSASVSRKGFTLVETIVALCIVAILTAIAVPGFRKATEDFRLNATLEDTLDIMKACRAYYLIFNEFPQNADWDDIPSKMYPFVPRHLIDASKRKWARRPLGNTAYCYDLENWMTEDSPVNGAGIALFGITPNTTDWNKCYHVFKSIVGERYVILNKNKNGMACLLPECPGSTIPNSTTTWENRYY